MRYRSQMDAPVKRIIAFPKNGNIYTERLYEKVEAHGVPVLEGTWSSSWLRRHIQRGDIVHIHWPSFLYYESRSRLRTAVRLLKMYINLKAIRARGASVVWTAHNLYPHEGGGDLWSHRVGRRLTLHFAERVIAHGRSAAAIVADEFRVPAARLAVGHHPNWIDSYANRVTRAESRAKLGIADDEYLYLHVGRCRPYKGLETLIDAFASVPQPARLLIAGGFSSPRYLEDIARRARAAPHVVLEPRSIPDDELQVYLNAADCVVLPYLAILTSGTALLALSFGRPVIGPDLGSMRDHVDGRSGILYDPNDPQGLVRAMQDIRARTFDPSATLTQARQFTWSHMADLLLKTGH